MTGPDIRADARYRQFMVTDGLADWVPSACTLPTAEQPLRVEQFDGLFASTRWYRRMSTVQLDVAIPPGAEPTGRALAELESRCCSFFAFAFESVADDVVMHIGVPPSQAAVLDALQERIAAGMRAAQ